MTGLSEKNQPAGVSHDNHLLHAELLAGLCNGAKRINPKFFYDEYGSQLFEAITRLPEYYPTRTELGLLETYRDEIATAIGEGQVLIEPGAGNCSKVRHLLPALGPACFVPIDLSRDFLFAAARQLQLEFPNIRMFPIADDMGAKIQLPKEFDALSKTVFYPGSTIGNYEPHEALNFLRHVREVIGETGGLLIGVDLQKDSAILHNAYNDAEGITALFNLNILTHVNDLVGANFDVSQFEHVGFYNEEACRIEMYLQSLVAQTVDLGEESITFSAGERIHTEYSYKYSLGGFADLARQAGLVPVKNWVDDNNLFSLQYYRVQ
jgi:L-histidine N-alpha-methyltransferase